ncbi:MAG TPA: hypothetical protein PLY87_25790 [Planctomycetaceae bacterium]|nr:hypothetical protein [Planctomycetaceae bacterium]HQZ68538.1 hypothetical protein [Planctomycetaceae bacterium]
MKSIAKLCVASVLVLVGVAQAGQELAPIPEAAFGGMDQVMNEPVIYMDPTAVEVYTNVKYKDLREMAPCAVPKFIMVKDPCACDDGCHPVPCVCIQICVPECGREEVTCRRHGDRIRYDYGKYAVDVRIKRNHIEVDYQD